MGVAQSVSFFIAHGLEKLVDPNGGIDSEAGAIEGLKSNGACTGMQNGPETCNTHFVVSLLGSREFPEV